MTDTPRGPTTEELRAAVLAWLPEEEDGQHPATCQCGGDGYVERGPAGATYSYPCYPWDCHVAGCACKKDANVPAEPAALLLTRPCLACNREQGERMCNLCQRLEDAEASVVR